MHWKPPRHAALCIALACSTASCSNDPSALYGDAQSHDAGPADAAASLHTAAGGFEFGDARCAGCVTASCNAEALACAHDPLCKSFWMCRARCDAGDHTCENRCRTLGWPWGGGAYVASASGELEACLAQHCEACDSHHVVGHASCAACTTSTCSDVDWESYARSVEAQHLEACDASCLAFSLSDSLRLGQCPCEAGADAPAEAVALQAARRACVTQSCAEECQGTPDFDCVGAVDWPRPEGPEATLRVIAWSYDGARPFADVPVRACVSTDYDCNSPIAGPTSTDAEGLAELTLPLRSVTAPFADRVEIRVDDYREISDMVPRPGRSYTVWLGTYAKTAVDAIAAMGPPGGGAVDRRKGAMIVYAWDCSGKLASGIQVSTEPAADVSYVGSASGNETAAPNGAVFFNIEPGTIRVTATRNGAFYAYAETFVVPMDVGVTWLELAPTPMLGN